jgi:hypothetical protein
MIAALMLLAPITTAATTVHATLDTTVMELIALMMMNVLLSAHVTPMLLAKTISEAFSVLVKSEHS